MVPQTFRFTVVPRFRSWLFYPLFWRFFEVRGDVTGRFGPIDFGGLLGEKGQLHHDEHRDFLALGV